MELQATALKGIVRSSDEGLFYLFPIQDVSTLQQAKAHLTCAIDVLSHPEECSPEQRLDAVRTLNSLGAALSVHDAANYRAYDPAPDGGNVKYRAGRDYPTQVAQPISVSCPTRFAELPNSALWVARLAEMSKPRVCLFILSPFSPSVPRTGR